MRATSEKIKEEAKEVYLAITQVMNKLKCDYCQSWWLNSKNFELKSNLSTQKINLRAKFLVNKGYLIVDNKNTSPSQGTRYKLTTKPFDL